MHIAPELARDRDLGSSRWLLALFDDGTPLIWERLPDERLSDENLVRHITTGPDGSIYLVIPRRDGMYVYRR